jgi:hypothetical protein
MKANYLLIICILLVNLISMASVSALSISVHVPEKYTEVEAGERFYFEVEIKYPENPERKDLRLEYEILNGLGEVIAQAKVLKAVETQASFMDFIVIPESAERGMHTIKVVITDYEELSQEAEASFHVTKQSDELKKYFFILLGAILFVGILITLSIIFKKR